VKQKWAGTLRRLRAEMRLLGFACDSNRRRDLDSDGLFWRKKNPFWCSPQYKRHYAQPRWKLSNDSGLLHCGTSFVTTTAFYVARSTDSTVSHVSFRVSELTLVSYISVRFLQGASFLSGGCKVSGRRHFFLDRLTILVALCSTSQVPL
jgi:hypothetical protein